MSPAGGRQVRPGDSLTSADLHGFRGRPLTWADSHRWRECGWLRVAADDGEAAASRAPASSRS